jgi:DNA mismatch endonuclease, patch repair protein
MSDPLTPAQRSYCMSQVKGKDTKVELLVRKALHQMGLRFRKHVKKLPGKPDVVFAKQRVTVFIDGEFWHGKRLATWAHTLQPYWKQKIEANRQRDRKNFASLRRSGWTVIRIWERDAYDDLSGQLEKILAALSSSRRS